MMMRVLREWVIAPAVAGVVVVGLLPLSLAAFGQLGLLGVGGTLSAGSGLSAITSATTYYICAKGAAGTCVYNGDAGTTATPSDSNDCLTKGTPCLTIDGVRSKIAGQTVAAVVTVQLADTAGTGTDCYRPNATVFNGHSISAELDTGLSAGEASGTGTYPSAYLYLHGNDTTPGNVLVTGATTCAGTTANDLDGVKFANYGAVRVRGVQAQYFKSGANGPDNGAFEFYHVKSVYAEDLNYTGDTTTTGTLLVTWGSNIRLGSSLQWTVTSGNVLDILDLSHGSFISPLGRANIAVTAGTGWTASGGLFTSNEKSHMGVDGLSLSVSGSGTAKVWYAIDHASIYWNDALTFVAPGQTHSYQGNGLTLDEADDWSYISDLCRTAGSLTCNIGTTTSIGYRARVQRNGYVRYISNATGVVNADTFDTFGEINGASHSYMGYPSTAFAQLGTPANGTMTYCADCAPASNPCTGTSTGSFAYRLNGAWKCF